MQAACREFLTDTQAIELQGFDLASVPYGGAGSWIFNQALGALRARVGTSTAVLIATFDIDVDEHLAKIMPPPIENKTASHGGRHRISQGQSGESAALPAAEADS